MTAKVDVAINVFGKVHQTALLILSLMECSGKHIDKIYFQEEACTAEYEFKKHDAIPNGIWSSSLPINIL